MRISRYAVIAAIGGAATIAPLSPAHASTSTPTTTSPAAAAAGWLARQLQGAQHDHYDYSGFPGTDYGTTADGVLGMDAAKVAQTAAAAATSFLAAGATDYATGGGTTSAAGKQFYAGALGKLLLVAEAQHAAIHAFGGLDLPALIKNDEQSSGVYQNTGDPQYGASVVDQALALIALEHTGSSSDAPDPKAIAWLDGQQCGDGSFQYDVQTTPAAICDDVDTTAYAAQALLAVDSPRAAATVNWLIGRRHADGGYGSKTSNANSTAVVVQVLLAAHRTSLANSGIAWLRAHQQGCTAPTGTRGAVAFASPYVASTALRATAQATQALAQAPLGAISATGATAAAPTLACAAAHPSPQPTATPHPTPSASVLSVHHRRTANDPATGVAASTTGGAAAGPATLPRTGAAPVLPTVALGLGALALGTGLVALGRRRRTA